MAGLIATVFGTATATTAPKLARKERQYSEDDMRGGLRMMLAHSRILHPNDRASPAAVAKFYNQTSAMEQKVRLRPVLALCAASTAPPPRTPG